MTSADDKGSPSLGRSIGLGVLVGGALGVLVWLATSLFWLFLFFAGAGAIAGLIGGLLLTR